MTQLEPAAARPEVYLDHAATTPVLAEAAEAFLAQLRRTGNPSSLHAAGRAARRVVEESRERIAQALDAHPGEVVLTAGGTEADNLAVKGTYWRRHAEDPRRTRVLTSAVEHHAVLDAAEWLAAHEGAVVELLPVDADGRLDLEALRDRLVAEVRAVVPDARLNGDPVDRLPGNAHLSFPGCEGDSLLMLLDHRGIQCSTGSACSAGVPQPSHVLLAMGRTEVEARSSLRFSLGHSSTGADVDAVAAAIGPVVERARAAGR